MISLTAAAADRIREQGAGEGEEPVHLRVAARVDERGAIEFGMGFDEPRAGDAQVACEGVVLLVAPASRELLEDVILDYLEVEPGEYRFVFARGNEP
jgi:iron-sulfur cluster assembly protein